MGSESHFAHRRWWLPDLKWDPPSRAEAGAVLARRGLAAYGPATPQDLAFWLGQRVTDVRSWLKALGTEAVEVAVEGTPHTVLANDLPDLLGNPPPRTAWPTRLLHSYDLFVLAHKDKSWLIDSKHYKRVWKTAGRVSAVVLVRGRIAGVWSYALKTRSVRVEVEAFGKLAARARKQIESEAERVARYLEVSLSSVDYI